jgi:hypothetical protein
MVDPQQIQALCQAIETSGSIDGYIEITEEAHLIEVGERRGVDQRSVEEAISQMCRERGWTREKEIMSKMHDMLAEAVRCDGAINWQTYQRIVNFATDRGMPYRDADEHCVTLILDNNWSVKQSIFGGPVGQKRKKYGL